VLTGPSSSSSSLLCTVGFESGLRTVLSGLIERLIKPYSRVLFLKQLLTVQYVIEQVNCVVYPGGEAVLFYPGGGAAENSDFYLRW